MSLQGSPPYEGGCLCGAIRYRIAAPAIGRIVHCHCPTCRRATGAQVVDWVTFRLSDWRVVKGQPGLFRSSPRVERQFCRNCGTPLTYRSLDLDNEIDVTAGSLDKPEFAVPDCHVFAPYRMPFLHLDPDLPDTETDI